MSHVIFGNIIRIGDMRVMNVFFHYHCQLQWYLCWASRLLIIVIRKSCIQAIQLMEGIASWERNQNVAPSCVMWSVRNRYPVLDELYLGFKKSQWTASILQLICICVSATVYHIGSVLLQSMPTLCDIVIPILLLIIWLLST